MLLALDVGNTHLHFGVYRERVLYADWRISTDATRTADEHGALVCSLLQTGGIDPASISAMAVSNVVPPLAPAIRQLARRYFRCDAEFIGETLTAEIRVRYQPPSAVGADRIADAVAVLAKHGAPAIVVDLGTATTFDAISREGEYLGGAIAPGVGISLDALFRTAAHLPRIELARPENVIGRSTVESMQSGAYYGFIGQVEGMVRRLKGELGEDARVIGTGGLAELIARDTDAIEQVDPFLTLEGLRILWEAHRSSP